MDQTATQIVAVVGLAVSTATGIIAYLNHRRIRSTCCGEKLEASLDIEETTPPANTLIRQESFNESKLVRDKAIKKHLGEGYHPPKAV